MACYVFRYFFDPGSGICLWSANDEARERFDYPVQLTDLGLSENLLRQAIYVMAWHDTALDWSHPSNASLWSDSERIRFQQASENLLAMLRQELGPEFEIRDEPSQTQLIDAVLSDSLYRIVSQFLNGKWERLRTVWNVPFEALIAEGKRRGMARFVSTRPAQEGYWLCEDEGGYCVQYCERGSNSDPARFAELEPAFRKLIQNRLNFFQLKLLP